MHTSRSASEPSSAPTMPLSMCRMPPPRRGSTSPQPVLIDPGSMPSVLNARELLVVDVEVGVDVLHVVTLLQHAHELQHFFRIAAADLDGVVSEPGDLRVFVRH